MSEPLGFTGGRIEENGQNMNQQATVPLLLRHQLRLAAAFLLAIWLLTVFLYWVAHRLQPAVFMALLPGLALTRYMQAQLAHHAGDNHRHGEPNRIFATLGSANWITLLRAGSVVGLAGFLPLPIIWGRNLPERLAWAPGIIYLGVCLADLLDGFIARRQGRETGLGKHLDIETDAAGLLTASLVAIALHRLPTIYLAVGLAYYFFILGIRVRRKRGLPTVALQGRPYARIIAGFQMGLVTLALMPVFDPYFSGLAAYIFMTPLLIGFLRDWLVVSCRVKTDAAQQSILDHRARSWIKKFLPLILRPAILAVGIWTLFHGGLGRTHVAWWLVPGAGCLLAGLGVMGRSAALCLVLMLGSNLSPFGSSMLSTLLFGAAAALMVTGTGTLSLWAPEEKILYRQS